MIKKRFFKRLTRFFVITLLLVLVFIVYYKIEVKMTPPSFFKTELLDIKINKDSALYSYNNNWLQQNKYGLWELMVAGDAEELGAINGALTQELATYQEYAFVERLKEMIPSESYINSLKYFTSWFNRDMDEYIPKEYLVEIFGVSQYALKDYEFIGDNYDRILNYHAAHDIGHALQNLNLVACTGFAGWNSCSADSSLIIGRNFDFYVGDKFAENKIVAFYKPKTGNNFMHITWGGLIGTVSGMNDKGLTITLNSAKSSIPMSARTPVSIVARNILQYADNIEQAYTIAKSFRTFVTETFLIGSAADGKAVLIEKTPDTTLLFDYNKEYIIATNHLQHEAFSNDEMNIENINSSASMYRYNRTEQLVNEAKKLSVENVASILRDTKGINNKNIGLSNEKAINQLIAHHSVIFKPEELKVWVSTSPYQLGEYVMYDLNVMFADTFNVKTFRKVEKVIIAADTLLTSKQYADFLTYKRLYNHIKQCSNNKEVVCSDSINIFKTANPLFFETWSLLGDYYCKINQKAEALECYNKALELELPRTVDRENIEEKINKLKE